MEGLTESYNFVFHNLHLQYTTNRQDEQRNHDAIYIWIKPCINIFMFQYKIQN